MGCLKEESNLRELDLVVFLKVLSIGLDESGRSDVLDVEMLLVSVGDHSYRGVCDGNIFIVFL